MSKAHRGDAIGRPCNNSRIVGDSEIILRPIPIPIAELPGKRGFGKLRRQFRRRRLRLSATRLYHVSGIPTAIAIYQMVRSGTHGSSVTQRKELGDSPEQEVRSRVSVSSGGKISSWPMTRRSSAKAKNGMSATKIVTPTIN